MGLQAMLRFEPSTLHRMGGNIDILNLGRMINRVDWQLNALGLTNRCASNIKPQVQKEYHSHPAKTYKLAFFQVENSAIPIKVWNARFTAGGCIFTF